MTNAARRRGSRRRSRTDVHFRGGVYRAGSSASFPVVLRARSSSWARRASDMGKIWPICGRSAPRAVIAQRSSSDSWSMERVHCISQKPTTAVQCRHQLARLDGRRHRPARRAVVHQPPERRQRFHRDPEDIAPGHLEHNVHASASVGVDQLLRQVRAARVHRGVGAEAEGPAPASPRLTRPRLPVRRPICGPAERPWCRRRRQPRTRRRSHPAPNEPKFGAGARRWCPGASARGRPCPQSPQRR